MAKQFARIEDNHRNFIGRQRIFFTASAAESDGLPTGLLEEDELVS